MTLWREGLLARAVLLGKTRGYRNHPQLDRFKALADPRSAIDRYLSRVLDEATARGYRFAADKIAYLPSGGRRIRVTTAQVAFEWQHLLGKLAKRSRSVWLAQRTQQPRPHDSFCVSPGPIAPWERGHRTGASAARHQGK